MFSKITKQQYRYTDPTKIVNKANSLVSNATTTKSNISSIMTDILFKQIVARLVAQEVYLNNYEIIKKVKMVEVIFQVKENNVLHISVGIVETEGKEEVIYGLL